MSRANSKLWFLRRLKILGVNREDLKDVYTKQIRSILEFAVPVWHSSLTGEDRLNIERIQKSALHIILGDDYLSYNSALKVMKLETLFRRIQKLCTKFAKNCIVSDKFKKWFKADRKTTVYSRTLRYERSPISYITELLNKSKILK